MPLFWMIFMFTIFFASIFSSDQSSQRERLAEGEAAAVAGSMMVYRNAASVFAVANPGFSGTASDGALALPNWYVKPQGLGNYIAGGTSYVYYTNMVPGLLGTLGLKTHSMNVGHNVNGSLQSPSAINTGITVPPQVPNSAVVIVQ